MHAKLAYTLPMQCLVPNPVAATQMFDICWGNEPITQYLINGHFVWRPLGPAFPVEYRNPAGTPPGDYVGLNFYSR